VNAFSGRLASVYTVAPPDAQATYGGIFIYSFIIHVFHPQVTIIIGSATKTNKIAACGETIKDLLALGALGDESLRGLKIITASADPINHT
jgi:hypothetical protein